MKVQLKSRNTPKDGMLGEARSFAQVWENLHKTAIPRFVDWKKSVALPRMFRRKGRAGQGTSVWSANSAWVRGVKGKNAPLISNARGTGPGSLARGFDITTRRTGIRSHAVSFQLILASSKPAADYLHEGTPAHDVRARWAKTLRIPAPGGGFIFRRAVRVGKTPARAHIVWTPQEDLDRLNSEIEKELKAWERGGGRR